MKYAAFVIASLTTLFAGVAMADEPVPVSLSERIGFEIDRQERDAYGLFPDIEGFRTARIFRIDSDKYRVRYTYDDDQDIESSSRTISAETFEHTRVHVQMAEVYLDTRQRASASIAALVVFQTALRYSIEHRYDVTIDLLEELRRDYPEQYDSLGGESMMRDAQQLAGATAVLSAPESLIDVSGRTSAYIFSGYYGLWLAFAVPAALDANDSEPYALSLLTVPAISILVAHGAMKGRNVTRADARLISSGGWLGTWQGLGWASLADTEGSSVVVSGILGGLVGITTAGIINRTTSLTTGHADLVGSGIWWGAWFGLLTAGFASVDDGDDVLRYALIGSNAAVLGAGLGARNTTLSRRRVRFMNLGGILGGFAGGGILLLATPEDEQAVAAILGATTVVGAWIGIATSREKASVQSSARAPLRSRSWSVRANVEVRMVGEGRQKRRTPHFGIAARF